MSITYETPIVGPTSSSVQVMFINENEETYSRLINVPRNSEGEIDDLVFTDILESHLKAVIYRNSIGLISFSSSSVVPTPQH